MFKLSLPSTLTVIVFLGLSMTSVLSHAKDIGFQCRSVYGNPSLNRQTVYSGILVELANGQQSLVYVPNSWGPGHDTPIRKSIMDNDLVNPVVKILWMGELALRETSDGKPKLVAVNEISGTYHQSTLRGSNEYDIPMLNDVKAMQNFLSTKDVWDISQTKFLAYKESQTHLDWMAEYLKQELKLSNTAHDVNNVFNPIGMSAQFMKMDPVKFAPIFKQALAPKYVTVIEALSKDTVFDQKLMRRLLWLTNTFLKSGEFTSEQLAEFTVLNNQFIAAWKTYSNELGHQTKTL